MFRLEKAQGKTEAVLEVHKEAPPGTPGHQDRVGLEGTSVLKRGCGRSWASCGPHQALKFGQ